MQFSPRRAILTLIAVGPIIAGLPAFGYARQEHSADYARKQTLKGAERYITQELKEHEEKVLKAQERIYTLEYQLFVALREQEPRQPADRTGRRTGFRPLDQVDADIQHVEEEIQQLLARTTGSPSE